MRWEDERYVRLYTRDTATWKLLPWQGRALLPLLLRKCDRAGIIDVGDDDTDGVAALVDLPTEVVEPGLAALVKRGVLEKSKGSLVFPKFIEAQEANKSDAARQKDSRERRRDLVRAGLAPDQRLPVVYFVQGENGGPIKIGRTDDLARRLVGLSTSSPDKLVVLAAAPGNESDERTIHAHFSPARQRGEWFAPTPGLMRFIAEVVRDGSEAIKRVTQHDPCHVTPRDTSQAVTRHGTGGVTPSLAVPNPPDCLPPGDAEGEPPHADKSDEQKPAEGRDSPKPATTPADDPPKGTDGASSAPRGASAKGTEGGAGEQGTLFVQPPADERPKRARRGGASKAPSEMPFTIGAALHALAESSNGRFAPGEGRDITKGVAAQLTAHVKKYPTLEEWRVLGEWLAAGGWSNLDTLSPSWAAGNSFCGAMVLARDWHARGRPALDGHRQHSAPQVPATVPLSASQYSAPKPLPEGVKSPSQIIRERQAAIAAARRAEVDRGTH